MSDKKRNFLDAIRNPTKEESEKLSKALKSIFTPEVMLFLERNGKALADAAARIAEMHDQAEETKNKIFNLIDGDGSLADFVDLPPINGIELLSVISEMDDRTSAKAKTLLKDLNKKRSKQMLDSKYKRPRKEKAEAIEYYRQHREKSQRECIEYLQKHFANGRERVEELSYNQVKGWLNKAR